MIRRILNISPGVLLFTVCMILNNTVTAQNSMGAKSISMGQAGVALPENSWSVFSNIAMMPTDQHRVSFFGFRYVGIAEITDMAASSNWQTSWGTVGAGMHRYGFNLFNENRFLLGYKNQLGKFHYGVSVSYTHIFQGENYGSAGATGIDIGLAAQVVDELWFGARATNLNRPSYGATDEELPREMAAGFSFRPAPPAILTAEIVKDVMFPVSFRGGVQAEIFRSLFVRGGITTEPSTYSFGFGYEASKWNVNMGLQQHNPLGLSPAVDLGLRF